MHLLYHSFGGQHKEIIHYSICLIAIFIVYDVLMIVNKLGMGLCVTSWDSDQENMHKQLGMHVDLGPGMPPTY